LSNQFKSVSKSFHLFLFTAFLLCNCCFSQTNDSSVISGKVIINDTVIEKNWCAEVLAKHTFLNSTSKPVSFSQPKRFVQNTDYLFYIISFLVLTIALFRLFNDKYYLNMTRVFFNSSLRQSQLVEQLLLDKQASLVWNLFFVVVMGIYLFQLLVFHQETSLINYKVLGLCMLLVLSVYAVKYFITLFFGWLTGFLDEAENYLFIVFLLNKMLALFLLPVILIMIYVDNSWVYPTIQFSFLLIGLVFFIRYFRAFGMLQYKMKVSRFHFLLYVTGVELLPILILYKSSMIIVAKNL
jgi:hypothetical protein